MHGYLNAAKKCTLLNYVHSDDLLRTTKLDKCTLAVLNTAAVHGCTREVHTNIIRAVRTQATHIQL